jgi:DAK2 domain fusion protein YloV
MPRARNPIPASRARPPAGRLDASELRELLRAATLRLEQRASAIDRLNVFPVPDADTGSNMAYGMRRGLREAEREPAAEAGAVAEAFARGALAGARGNSGLILSQFWRGLAQAARGARTLGVEELARGLAAGSALAFRAVAKPLPGTILTVMADVARAARGPRQARLAAVATFPAFLGRLVETARESVARTPQLLAVLRRSGVVDAGAEGLHRILEGAWRYVRERAGEPAPAEAEAEAASPEPGPPPAGGDLDGPGGTAYAYAYAYAYAHAYGICTEFFLQGRALDPDKVRAALRELGDSLIVTPDAQAVRVHIHTGSPQAVLERAATLGHPAQVSLRDMDAQRRDLEGRPRGGGLAGGPADDPADGTTGGQAVIARVPGRGLAAVFRSLGAAEAAVRGDPGEETRLIAALRSLPAGDLLLIPNSPDPELDGAGLRPQTSKRLHLLPARTVPQGVAAMVAFDPGTELAENLRRMDEAIAAVGTLEVREEAGRVIGLVEGERAAKGRGLGAVLEKLLPRARAARGSGPAERLTLYYGADLEEAEALGIGAKLREAHPGLQVEVLPGGQPGRGLIVGVE